MNDRNIFKSINNEMKKYQFRANPEYNQASVQQIDNEKGVIYGVVLAQKGMNKNGTYFSERFLNELKSKGDERGYIKARFGHPTMCNNSLGSYIGRYKNFKVEDEKIFGDLYLDDIAKDTNVEGRGITMYDYIMRMAQSNSEMFGNSIVILANDVIEEYEEGGEKKEAEGHELIEWISSDLVDDPAATDSLFHSANDDLGVKFADFLDENPEVFDILEKDPKILGDFFNRYEAYISRKNNKKDMKKGVFARALEALFGKSLFDVDLTLANGDIITVETEAEEPAVGDKVKQKTDGGEDAEKPLADGEYVLKDESTLVVEGGAIKEIKEKESPKDEENEVDKGAGVDEEFAQSVMDGFEMIAKRIYELQKKFDQIEKTQSRFKEEDTGATSNEPSVVRNGLDMDKIRKRLGRIK
jgi:hypothetical protein|nr:MAG TPA: hypothetical protein [Caudoviricetes sp.]